MMARRAGERGERVFGVMSEVSGAEGDAARGACGWAGQAGGARAAMIRRAWASRHSAAAGQAEAMATVTRRALMRTSAPIFRSLRRIVPQVAEASAVWESPIRRKAHSST